MTRLKELRKEKGLSQQALANELGVHYRTLQNWENGETDIKLSQAKMLADYFGVSETYLLGYSDIKNEADIKVAVLDETIEKLCVIKDNMILRESDEGPNLLDLGLVTAIAAIESFKKEIEGSANGK
uniref:Repressor protein CI n=1 Tax=Siphoviridae sp. ctC6Q17 TaxID=2827271 RepID=A0A8S5R3M2_9CAUD|nr:MAG TPA: Repressor protein CI [Siphoviridae sp. ctC6Q17]